MILNDPVITLIILGLPFLAAAVSPVLVRLLGAKAGWVLALFPAFVFYQLFTLLPVIADNGVIRGGVEWVPSLGVDLSYFFDGLSLTFALLISGIGTLIIIYAGGYMAGHPQQGRFFAFLFLFMGSMLGLVSADNLYTMFVLWELTSITSFLLIGFDHKREASRRAALQALIVTGGGGLVLMAGVITLNIITGANDLSGVLASGEVLRESPLYLLAFVLVLGGCFTKSAQFPFHFWLPNAMEAPTPVSAYLHSATMVKAGVYLLMRLNPVMGDTEIWGLVLPLLGGTTLLVGTFLAIRQTDLKLMLAYTTVASLGLLVMLTGWGSKQAIEGAVLYLIAHSLFKGALFMVAGCIDHETGTRDVTKLGGLRKAMPMTFTVACLAALSMGGMVPFFGFMAKEEIYAGLLKGETVWLIITVAIAGNALMLAIGAAIAIKPFAGQMTKTPKVAHEGPISLWLGPLILSWLGLLGALVSSTTHKFFSSPMSSAVYGQNIKVKILGYPDHLSVPLFLSVATIILGLVCFAYLNHLRNFSNRILKIIGWGPDKGFDQFISGLLKFSYNVTSSLQTGRLETYLTVTFAFVAMVLWVPMVFNGELPQWPLHLSPMPFSIWAIMLLAIVGLIAVVNATSRLTAIICLGIQGFGVAILFMHFGAPDLSFTQFMVETLSVVILALVMTRLRLQPSDHRDRRRILQDGTIALLCGTGFAAVLLSTTQVAFDPSLSQFFEQFSRTIAHGRNIVNVIIVDLLSNNKCGRFTQL